MNILYLIFLFLFFKCAGNILARPLKIKADNHLIQIALGLIAASYLTLFLASQGWLDRNLILALMGTIILIRIKSLLEFLVLIYRKAMEFFNNLSGYGKIILLILILQAAINFFLTLTPPTGWDSLAYHLTIPKLIIQEGRRIHYADYGGANYPLLVEMIFTLGLLVHDAELVKLICWGISVLTVMAIYRLAAKIGLKPVALIGSLIFYSTQVVSMWAGKCYIDIALAFFVTSAAIILIEFLQGKPSSLILTWLFISILPGIKYSGLILSLIMGSWLIGQIFIRTKNIKSIIKPLSLGLLIILAVNSPWYFIHKPKQISVVDSAISYTRVLDSERTSIPYMIKNYLKYWGLILGKLTLKWDRDGRIGPVFLGFLPLLILIRPLRKEIRLLLAIALSYMAIFLFFGLLAPRYVVPVMPIMAIIAVYVVMRLAEGDKVLSYFLRGCLVFTFIFNLGLTLYNHRLELAYLAGKISQDNFLNTKVRCHSAINYINQNISQGTVLLIGETRVYYLDRPFFLLQTLGGRSVREIDEIIRAKNITYILVNERIIYKVKNNIEMQEVLKYLNERLEIIYNQGDFKVYKLSPYSHAK